MKYLKLFSIMLLIALLGIFSACSSDSNKSGGDVPSVGDVDYTASDAATDHVLVEMADGSKFIIELYPDLAPITVANFKDLVAQKFYDGLTFHRIYAGFVIQGGDPKGDGTGGSGNPIKGEFALNGFNNKIDHVRGVVSMARRSDSYNSATSQFFVCLSDETASQLDGGYAAFGRVIAGMDTVDMLAALPVIDRVNHRPVVNVVMKSVSFINIEK